MNISDFKELEVKEKKSLRTLFKGKQFKRTLIFMVGGAIISVAWFYYGEGQHLGEITSTHWFKSAAVGALFGIFISNSPCARGQC